MSIPVSTIVSVSISVSPQFPSRAGFGTLNIVTAETDALSIAERAREYTTLAGVTTDWGANTEVAAAATAYFAQQPKPTSLVVSNRFEAAQSAELRGGSNAEDTAATWAAITDGEFEISIDGVQEDISTINFTGDTSMALVAATIETAIQAIAAGGYTAATCTWDDRFFITSGTTGVASTISFVTAVSPTVGTDVSTMMGCSLGEGTKSDGFAAETITASLTAIQAFTDTSTLSDWYGLAFTKEVRDLVQVNAEDAVEAAADWCEARIKTFFNTTNDLDSIDSVAVTDIGYLLEAKSLRRTMTTFSTNPDQYPSCSLAGRAFTVNFNQPDSTITLKFKQMPTITVENLTSGQKSTLDAKAVNALVDVGGNTMFAESFMANGVFFDEVHGLDWLENAIQTNVFGYLYTKATKVPYTNEGVAALEQQVIKALEEGVRNGFLAPGETIDGEYLANGYSTTTVDVADVNDSDREARLYPSLSFIAIGAGAIHGVQIAGTFVR